MNTIKWFTERVTGLIVYPTIFLLIPFVLAKIGQFAGLWMIVDNVYASTVIYWILFIVTRGVFALLWVQFSQWFMEKGTRFGFFWFKPERPSRSTEAYVDKSSEIVGVTLFFVLALIAAEFAIRLTTLTFPPFLPPPVR